MRRERAAAHGANEVAGHPETVPKRGSIRSDGQGTLKMYPLLSEAATATCLPSGLQAIP
jgi:hypothetical protein